MREENKAIKNHDNRGATLKSADTQKELSYGYVTITDAYMMNAFQKECDYLKSLDADRLLKGFRDVAGIAANDIRYPGWEETEIQGHTIGHYLTAMAQAYAYEKDLMFHEKITYVIAELEKCQMESGYLFAWKEEIFDRIEQAKPAWVPWYTMHKIMEGLLSCYRLAGVKQALEVAKKLGNWIANRALAWDEKMIRTVLSVEYGGMNDCLYELYEDTKDETYERTAHVFDEIPLFEQLQKGKDVLNGLHANTTIPKILGAANRYRLKKDVPYRKTAEAFWEMVVKHHTYVTGGNSEWEHFGRPDALNAERTACNCETCNTYNMLKLSKRLFQFTENEMYMDYYEHTLTNAILSSQNPKTGMTMYFQPMATGYFKTYSTPYDKFWCCTGTGMENFTKLCEGIYFQKNTELYIARFVSSIFESEELGLWMKMELDFTKSDGIKLQIKRTKQAIQSIRMKMPDWAYDGIYIKRKDVFMHIAKEHKSIYIQDLAQKEDISLSIPMCISYKSLLDDKNTVAFLYGPYVLGANMGTYLMNTTTTGVDVTVAQKEFFVKDYLVIDTSVQEWLRHIKDHFVKADHTMEFLLESSKEEEPLIFVPYYQQYEQRYGIYFRIYQKDSRELMSRHRTEEKTFLVQKEATDIIPVGNDQYELAHQVRGEKTDFCIHNGHRCRFIEQSGYLSYQLKVSNPLEILCITYQKRQENEWPNIWIGDVWVEDFFLFRESEDGFVTMGYHIPKNQITGNNTINVKFQNKSQEYTSRIYDYVYICEEKQGEGMEDM